MVQGSDQCGETRSPLGVSSSTLAAMLDVDWKGAWVDLRAVRKLSQLCMGETMVAGSSRVTVGVGDSEKCSDSGRICRFVDALGVWRAYERRSEEAQG